MTVAQFLNGQELIQLQSVSRASRDILRRQTRISISSSKPNVSVPDIFGNWITHAPFLEEMSLTLQHDEAILIFEKVHPLHWPSRLHTLALNCKIAYEEDLNIFKHASSLTKLELPQVIQSDLTFLEFLPRGLRHLSLPNLNHGFPLHILPPSLVYLNLQKATLLGTDLVLPAGMDPPLPNLKTLVISKSQIDDEYLDHLPQTIEELDLQDSELLTDNGVARLPRNLTYLNIKNASNITDNSGKSFPIHLTSLDVNNNSLLSNTFVALLASMETHQQHLRELRIEDSKVNIFALPHIEQLKNLTRLHPPFLFTKDLKQELIPRLPPDLVKLDVSANRVLMMPGRGDRLIGWSLPKHLTQLRWAIQDAQPFEDAHFAHLPRSLLTLDLKNCADVCPIGLARLKHLVPQLTELKISGAKNLKPSILRHLPPSLTHLELPVNLMNALNNYNMHPISQLNLVQLNLASIPCRFDSSIFFVLPRSITHLSIPHLKFVSPIHVPYLPNDLKHLSLPSVTNLSDDAVRLISRQLESLELHSCENVSPLALANHRYLQSLKLGLTWNLLEALRQHLGRAHATDVLQSLLPSSLTSLELPRLHLPDGITWGVQDLGVLSNLDHLVVGSKDSFRGSTPRPLFLSTPITEVR